MKARLLLFIVAGALIAYLSTRVLALNGGMGTTEASVEDVSSHPVVLVEVARLEPSDADMGFGDGFGYTSMAIDGDWVVVGAPFDAEYGHYSGAAYVYRRVGTTWVEHDKLPSLPLGDTMGWSVAIDGNWIVAGAPSVPDWPSHPLGIGRVYVFWRDEQDTPDDASDDVWQLAAILNPPPSQWCCGFGLSVDIGGDTIVVGRGSPADQPGRAYVFRWDGLEWRVGATLVGSDSEPGDSFGTRVAVADSDHILVAARYDEYPCDGHDACRGSVYVFRDDNPGWTEEAKLIPSDPRPYGTFGRSVAADGDVAIVGRIGSAYLFRREGEGWTEHIKLTPSDSTARFGWAVSLSADTAVVGAPQDFNGEWYTGAVYVFRNHGATWTQQYKFVASDPTPGLNLGTTVSVSGNYAVAGLGAYVFAVGPPLGLPDHALFQRCFMPQEGPLSPECEGFDFDPDEVIDLSDHALMLQTFRGP